MPSGELDLRRPVRTPAELLLGDRGLQRLELPAQARACDRAPPTSESSARLRRDVDERADAGGRRRPTTAAASPSAASSATTAAIAERCTATTASTAHTATPR